MSEVTVVIPDGKTANQRLAMHALYAAHTLAWATAGMLAVAALVVNCVLRADEVDPVYLSHHHYMVRTFWWTLGWLVLLSPLWLLVLPGAVAYTVVGLWYLYRCLRGWLRFHQSRMAP